MCCGASALRVARFFNAESTVARSSGLALAAVRCRSTSVLHALLNANRRRFELRSSELGIHGINREIVRRNLFVKMDGEEREPRPQAGIKAHRRKDRAAARADAHLLAFAHAVARAIFRREVKRCRTAQRRRKSSALLPRVVRIQMSASRQPNRILLIQ